MHTNAQIGDCREQKFIVTSVKILNKKKCRIFEILILSGDNKSGKSKNLPCVELHISIIARYILCQKVYCLHNVFELALFFRFLAILMKMQFIAKYFKRRLTRQATKQFSISFYELAKVPSKIIFQNRRLKPKLVHQDL